MKFLTKFFLKNFAGEPPVFLVKYWVERYPEFCIRPYTLIVLGYFQGYTIEEIAEMNNMTRERVRQTLRVYVRSFIQ
jgi:hypothetical protein